MQRRTYNNVMKAIKMIQAKGYDFNEASEIALKCFDNHEQCNNGMSVEYFINRICPKAEFESMYR